MAKKIVIIQGHPDPAGGHFGHALADAYTASAEAAGHTVNCINVAELDFPLLRTAQDWEHGEPNEAILTSQLAITAADHLLLIYPLWLGTMPALMKGFLEQVFRPDFTLDTSNPGKTPKKLLRGKSAHIVITMGMPAFLYRCYFRAHSLKSLERNILRFCGIRPIHASLIGTVEGKKFRREKWLRVLSGLGGEGR